MQASEDYRFHHAVEVRFRDIDVGGHAHHSEALMYFEEARAAYWRQIAGRPTIEDIDYVVAEAEIRWHRRVHWPQTLSVAARVSRLGRKHFEMEYEVLGRDGELLISGRTVQVMYDYEAERPKRLSDELRAAIEAHEGPFDRRGRPSA